MSLLLPVNFLNAKDKTISLSSLVYGLNAFFDRYFLCFSGFLGTLSDISILSKALGAESGRIFNQGLLFMK